MHTTSFNDWKEHWHKCIKSNEEYFEGHKLVKINKYFLIKIKILGTFSSHIYT